MQEIIMALLEENDVDTSGKRVIYVDEVLTSTVLPLPIYHAPP